MPGTQLTLAALGCSIASDFDLAQGPLKPTILVFLNAYIMVMLSAVCCLLAAVVVGLAVVLVLWLWLLLQQLLLSVLSLLWGRCRCRRCRRGSPQPQPLFPLESVVRCCSSRLPTVIVTFGRPGDTTISWVTLPWRVYWIGSHQKLWPLQRKTNRSVVETEPIIHLFPSFPPAAAEKSQPIVTSSSPSFPIPVCFLCSHLTETAPTNGCGSTHRYQNGTLVSGNTDQNLRFAPPVSF